MIDYASHKTTQIKVYYTPEYGLLTGLILYAGEN